VSYPSIEAFESAVATVEESLMPPALTTFSQIRRPFEESAKTFTELRTCPLQAAVKRK